MIKSPAISARSARFLLLAAIVLPAAACSPVGDGGEEAVAPSLEERIEEVAETVTDELSAEAQWLDDRFFEIGSTFDGYLGIAMTDLQTGEVVHFNGEEALPQQSLSKLWVALAAFDQADDGKLGLEDRATVTFSDLTVFHQPLRKQVVANGSFTTDYADYIRRALTESDNTANDMVLKAVGGPDAVRAMLRRKGLEGIRFGPGERRMQAAIAGLEWDQRYSVGKTFFEVRDEVPDAVRKPAFDAYVADPVDGAQPVAIASALARLAMGELLSRGSTDAYLALLDDVKSGPNRLKGGLPPEWSIGHKTGTGQVFDPKPVGGPAEQAGYNDVGILTAPDGKRYSVAVMIGRTARPVPERMDMMHEVVGAIAAYHGRVTGGTPESAS